MVLNARIKILGGRTYILTSDTHDSVPTAIQFQVRRASNDPEMGSLQVDTSLGTEPERFGSVGREISNPVEFSSLASISSSAEIGCYVETKAPAPLREPN